MFELIFLIALAGYIIQSAVFLIGVKKKFRRLPDDRLPTATVIVAARNEEDKIMRCLASLDAVEYPEGKLEIIMVDDKSTDATGTIIDTFIAGKPRFKKIESRKEFGRLKGKTNALANALEIAAGEVIMTTDADCAVSPAWVKTMASYYTDDVAAVNGFTRQEYDGAFTGMQNLDFLYLLTVASGTINLGYPLSCIGNNMSYRKKAYEEVGGYEKLPFSVTEDFNLLMAIHKLNKYKIIFPLDRDSLVASLPITDFRTLYRQKHRWGVGGLKSPFRGYFVMANGWTTHLCMLAAPFFFTSSIGWMIFMKLLVDYTTLRLSLGKLGLRGALKHFAAFEAYYVLYVLALPVTLLFDRTVLWKDRKF